MSFGTKQLQRFGNRTGASPGCICKQASQTNSQPASQQASKQASKQASSRFGQLYPGWVLRGVACLRILGGAVALQCWPVIHTPIGHGMRPGGWVVGCSEFSNSWNLVKRCKERPQATCVRAVRNLWFSFHILWGKYRCLAGPVVLEGRTTLSHIHCFLCNSS